MLILDAKVLPAISAIRSAILRLDPNGGTLTPNHLVLLDYCLSTRNYREALPVLQKVITGFPGTKHTVTIVDGAFLCSPHSDSSNYIQEGTVIPSKYPVADAHEYFLLGALVYIGLRQWSDALLYLEHVLASPTMGAPSGIQVEAYQKWLLVSSLVYGRVSAMNNSSLRGSNTD